MSQFVQRILLGCALFVGTAQAADHAVSVEIGTLQNSDASYDLFGYSNAMTSYGLRGAYAVHDRISITAGYHHHQRGARVEQWDGETDEYAASFVNVYNAHLISVGGRADLQPWKWLQVYTRLSGLMVVGTVRMDQNTDSRTNPGQIRAVGVSGGAEWLGGLEFQIGLLRSRGKDRSKPRLKLATYVEAGGGVVARHGYGSVKDVNAEVDGFEPGTTLFSMAPGGFVLRSGIGLRF